MSSGTQHGQGAGTRLREGGGWFGSSEGKADAGVRGVAPQTGIASEHALLGSDIVKGGAFGGKIGQGGLIKQTRTSQGGADISGEHPGGAVPDSGGKEPKVVTSEQGADTQSREPSAGKWHGFTIPGLHGKGHEGWKTGQPEKDV